MSFGSHSASRSQSQESSGFQSGSSFSAPVWSGDAQKIIKSLALSSQAMPSTIAISSAALNKILGSDSSQYAQQVVNANNAVSDAKFKAALGDVRSGGFRGGQNADIYNQGTLAQQYANQQAADNAATMLGQYNTDVTQKINAANTTQNYSALLTNLLNALKGTTSAYSGTTASRGISSGSSSGTNFGIGLSLGLKD
jgi:hypothetical protein